MGIIYISVKQISNLIINLKSYHHSSRHISPFLLHVNHAKVTPPLKQIHKSLDRQSLKILITSIVLPNLDYCIRILQSLQKITETA